jgi:hypothetical protein
MASLLMNRFGGQMYGNAFIYCYRRDPVDNYTFMSDVTLNTMNEVFGIYNKFVPKSSIWTPAIHRAVDEHHIKGFLENGADPNARDSNGNLE